VLQAVGLEVRAATNVARALPLPRPIHATTLDDGDAPAHRFPVRTLLASLAAFVALAALVAGGARSDGEVRDPGEADAAAGRAP
jgi:hypothetical protein